MAPSGGYHFCLATPLLGGMSCFRPVNPVPLPPPLPICPRPPPTPQSLSMRSPAISKIARKRASTASPGTQKRSRLVVKVGANKRSGGAVASPPPWAAAAAAVSAPPVRSDHLRPVRATSTTPSISHPSTQHLPPLKKGETSPPHCAVIRAMDVL